MPYLPSNLFNLVLMADCFSKLLLQHCNIQRNKLNEFLLNFQDLSFDLLDNYLPGSLLAEYLVATYLPAECRCACSRVNTNIDTES
jgi:hypothetical protein